MSVNQANLANRDLFGYTTSISPVYYSGGAWVPAIASAETSLVRAITLSDGLMVSNEVVNFPDHGLAVGYYYYLSDASAGTLTPVQPSLNWIQRVLYVIDSSHLDINIQQGYYAGTASISGAYCMLGNAVATTITANATTTMPFATILGAYGQGCSANTANNSIKLFANYKYRITCNPTFITFGTRTDYGNYALYTTPVSGGTATKLGNSIYIRSTYNVSVSSPAYPLATASYFAPSVDTFVSAQVIPPGAGSFQLAIGSTLIAQSIG